MVCFLPRHNLKPHSLPEVQEAIDRTRSNETPGNQLLRLNFTCLTLTSNGRGLSMKSAQLFGPERSRVSCFVAVGFI